MKVLTFFFVMGFENSLKDLLLIPSFTESVSKPLSYHQVTKTLRKNIYKIEDFVPLCLGAKMVLQVLRQPFARRGYWIF